MVSLSWSSYGSDAVLLRGVSADRDPMSRIGRELQSTLDSLLVSPVIPLSFTILHSSPRIMDHGGMKN
jgi:hypothetical protein